MRPPVRMLKTCLRTVFSPGVDGVGISYGPGIGSILCDALFFRPAVEDTLMYCPRNGKRDFGSNPLSAVYQQPAFVELLCKVILICSTINFVVEYTMLSNIVLSHTCIHMALEVRDEKFCGPHTIFGDLFVAVREYVSSTSATLLWSARREAL
eukprot:SAG31_NODE_5308_length_2619_cov_2.319048_3_plen_153_part_00